MKRRYSLLQAQHLPREKEAGSVIVDWLQCNPRLPRYYDDTGDESATDNHGERNGVMHEEECGEEHEERQEGRGGRDPRTEIAYHAADDGDDGDDGDAGGDGGLLGDSAYGCAKRPFNIRLTWLSRTVISAAACVCAA